MKNQMQFQAGQSASIGPKAAIIAWYTCCSAAAVWLTLIAPLASATSATPSRRAVLLACVALYIGRAAHTLFVFVRRRVPWWEAAWGGIIIGCVLFFFLRDGLRAPQPFGAADVASLVLYLVGSCVGTASEQLRHVWKTRPENRGHIYTDGLFRYARHINYFGDLLLFAGLGLLTRQAWTLIVPLAMGVNFVFVIIPAHDAYLAERYGAEFGQYARRTKRLIPWVY